MRIEDNAPFRGRQLLELALSGITASMRGYAGARRTPVLRIRVSHRFALGP